MNSILTVVVVPLQPDLSPYLMQIDISPEGDRNLKTVFQREKHWKLVFKGHSPIYPPQFRVFKQSVSNYTSVFPQFSNLKLQILSLKAEGYQFPKNPNALPLEQFCKQHFFGPLVVAFQTESAPPYLKNFIPEVLEQLRCINESEGRNYPAPPTPSIINKPSFLPKKQEKIENVQVPKDLQKMLEILNEPKISFLSPQKQLEHYLASIEPTLFYLYRYKTKYCKNRAKDHDWNHCVYAHKPFDHRRAPDSYFYVPEKCKNYDQETGLGCRDECVFSHTTFERLYHPYQYKTNICQQFIKKRKHCPKGELCAFVHYSPEMRDIGQCDKLFPFQIIKERLLRHLEKSNVDQVYRNIIENCQPVVQQQSVLLGNINKQKTMVKSLNIQEWHHNFKLPQMPESEEKCDTHSPSVSSLFLQNQESLNQIMVDFYPKMEKKMDINSKIFQPRDEGMDLKSYMSDEYQSLFTEETNALIYDTSRTKSRFEHLFEDEQIMYQSPKKNTNQNQWALQQNFIQDIRPEQESVTCLMDSLTFGTTSTASGSDSSGGQPVRKIIKIE